MGAQASECVEPWQRLESHNVCKVGLLTRFLLGFQRRNLQAKIDGPHAAKGGVTTLIAELSQVGIRARRRIACRLLPFVFLIFV